MTITAMSYQPALLNDYLETYWTGSGTGHRTGGLPFSQRATQCSSLRLWDISKSNNQYSCFRSPLLNKQSGLSIRNVVYFISSSFFLSWTTCVLPGGQLPRPKLGCCRWYNQVSSHCD
jgi:hypothetical protein